MSRIINIFKGLGYAYIFTLVVVLIYNALLTFTKLSSDNTGLVLSIIMTFGAAFGGFYACKQIKEKGMIYGLLEGLLYIIFLIILIFLAKENFSFEISMLYSIILTTLAGGIGGIIGVNFKS
ncbi:MAG: TIGR04086 family membrane protein [Intestinibacter sp.]